MRRRSWSSGKATSVILGALFTGVAQSLLDSVFSPHCTIRNSAIPLLYSHHDSWEVFGSESTLIHAIRASQSTTDLFRLLEDHIYDHKVSGSCLPTDDISPINLNVTATALRRLAHLSQQKDLSEAEKTNLENAEDQKMQLLGSLLNQADLEFTTALGVPETLLDPYSLADTLIAFGILSQTESISDQLLQKLMKLLDRHEAKNIHAVGLIRMVQCVQAMSRLQLDEQTFQDCIFQRLLKPDAVAKLPARTISHGLAALAHSSTNNRESKLLSRAFMRRLRKTKVREQATLSDLLRALAAADRLLLKPGMDEFRDETAIFGFTLLRHVIEQKKRDSKVVFCSKTVSDLISIWARLSNNEREDGVIEELLRICETDCILQQCNIDQLEKILVSVERLRVSYHANTMEVAGERFLSLVEENIQSPSIANISPRAVSSILRCPVLLHRKSREIMKPFIAAARILFNDEDFVNSCSLSEIANFMWFKSVVKWRDQKVLELFSRRILDPDLADSCSPKLASRILGVFTTMMPLEPLDAMSDDNVADRTSQIFHCYGVHLLSTRLTPAEAATALYSYAKASYVHDMGIFDHLASSVSLMCNRCTTRQLSQSLWSCGKMVAFEQPYGNDLPPYHNCAMVIAHELCQRSHELAPPDVAQCIWALARLRVTEESYLQPLTERAVELSQSMNTIEVVNILWGLGKLRYIATDLILILTDRLMEHPLDATPKQAASAVFALGRLDFRNKDLFDRLCAILIDQINETSAQSVANVLWAYSTVDLRPPEALLNFWATEKLGLIGVQSVRPK